MMPRHTLLAVLRDKPGALHRAVTLFRRRSYNIASLQVERTEMAGLSRMTVAVEAHSPEPMMKELERLVDVLSVRDITSRPDAGVSIETVSHSQADGVCDDGGAA